MCDIYHNYLSSLYWELQGTSIYFIIVMRDYKIFHTNIYFTEIKSARLIEFNRYNIDRRVPFNKKW